MLAKMERFGCERSVVGLVIPAGYSFNLDGTSIYLSMAAIFVAQVFKVPLTLTQQLTVLGVLMLTSKGAAGVTGSGFARVGQHTRRNARSPDRGRGHLAWGRSIHE